MTEEQQKTQDNESFAQLFEQQQATTTRLEKGQKVTGTIIEIAGDNVFVDMGIKVDGVMDRKDIVNARGEETLRVGDTVEAWVVQKSPHEVRLSRSMSGSGLAAIEDACSTGIPVEGRVTGTCKGGYTVEVLGRRAFCPGSQMMLLSEGEDVTGRTISFLVMRVEERGRNIVVSHRALLDRERAGNLEKLMETLHEGETVEGKVTRLVSFGAFVELAPGVEGLVHISELSWSRVEKAEEAVNVGDVVRVRVLSIKTTDKGVKISLSRRQAEGDPWEKVQDRLEVGQIVQGRVVRLVDFGAFVELFPGVEGMVHVSEMAWGRRVHRPDEVVSPGDTVTVRILDMDPAARRIALSIRDAEGDPWSTVDERFSVGTTVTGTVESQSPFGIFVQLEPGITGLMPMQMIRSARNPELAHVNPGDSITATVQRVDKEQHRISLVPQGMKDEAAAPREESDWKAHVKSGGKQDLGILGQALQKALQKKK